MSPSFSTFCFPIPTSSVSPFLSRSKLCSPEIKLHTCYWGEYPRIIGIIMSKESRMVWATASLFFVLHEHVLSSSCPHNFPREFAEYPTVVSESGRKLPYHAPTPVFFHFQENFSDVLEKVGMNWKIRVAFQNFTIILLRWCKVDCDSCKTFPFSQAHDDSSKGYDGPQGYCANFDALVAYRFTSALHPFVHHNYYQSCSMMFVPRLVYLFLMKQLSVSFHSFVPRCFFISCSCRKVLREKSIFR